MPITSQNPGSTRFGDVAVSDTHAAGLLMPGTIKPILLTVEARLVIKTLGRLGEDDLRAMRQTIARLVG